MKCPNCGSSAQPRAIKTEYIEDGWEISAVRTYECECGCRFKGTTVYVCQECYEIIESED